MAELVFGRLEGSTTGKVHHLVRGIRMWRVDHAPGDPLTLYRAEPDPSLTATTCKRCLKRAQLSSQQDGEDRRG